MDKKHLQSTKDLPPSYDEAVYYDAYLSKLDNHKKQPVPVNQKRGLHRCLSAVLLLLSLLSIAIGGYLLLNSYSRELSRERSVLTNLINRLKAEGETLNSHTDSVMYELTFDEVIQDKVNTCSVKTADKIDCYPGGSSSQEKCEAKGKH